MIRKAFIMGMIIAGSGVGGCTILRPTMSYVEPLTEPEAIVLANDISEHLITPLPRAQTTIVLDAPADTSKDLLTPVLAAKLRENGYGVVEADPKKGPDPNDGTPIRYLVTPLESGIVLRLQYPGAEASRFYPRGSDGNLMTSQPFTVREG